MSICSMYHISPNRNMKNRRPVLIILCHMARLIMNAVRWRGASSITDADGGRDARAMAANVSIIRFTHSIWVTVSGDCNPMNAPESTMRQATMFTVIWNITNRWILRYRERPHITALPIDEKELSTMVMSEASLATDVPSPIDSPTCALFSAGASLVPSPVTATTSLLA